MGSPAGPLGGTPTGEAWCAASPQDWDATAALDAGLIAAAQAVEHYEITRYGTLRRWAKMLGMDEAASLLEQTLTEESETDDLLTQIADAGANKEALAEAKGGS